MKRKFSGTPSDQIFPERGVGWGTDNTGTKLMPKEKSYPRQETCEAG